MKTIHVALKNNSYEIGIGWDTLHQIGKKIKALDIGRDALVITHPCIFQSYGKRLRDSLHQAGLTVKIFNVPEGEQSKSVRVAHRLIEQIARYDELRRIFIVAFGGGVIGDLAGYVAAIYKRGVPYVQVPTTFLAQIDSAIGGKVAVDLPIGKNLVGAFYQPKLVFSDVSLLSTLDQRQVMNGLSEAVKYGVIQDRQLFDMIADHYTDLLKLQPDILTSVISSCCQIKARIVSQDEKETEGIRTILNFGHTIGHAIEAAARYHDYHHGEAIAIGMRVAAEISLRLHLCREKDARQLNDVLSYIGLPKTIRRIRLSQIMRIMKHDKKFIRGRNRFVLMEKIGKVKIHEGVSMAIIEEAIHSVQE